MHGVQLAMRRYTYLNRDVEHTDSISASRMHRFSDVEKRMQSMTEMNDTLVRG